MKVLIVVYEGDEWKRDTLESRMVDVRIEKMVEFTRNQVPIQVLRQEEVTEWVESQVGVVNWPNIEKMIEDPTTHSVIKDYWTKALELHREGLSDLDIVMLKEAD